MPSALGDGDTQGRVTGGKGDHQAKPGPSSHTYSAPRLSIPSGLARSQSPLLPVSSCQLGPYAPAPALRAPRAPSAAPVGPSPPAARAPSTPAPFPSARFSGEHPLLNLLLPQSPAAVAGIPSPA